MDSYFTLKLESTNCTRLLCLLVSTFVILVVVNTRHMWWATLVAGEVSGG